MVHPSPEAAGPILWMWILAAVGGNLFAVYWLVKALLLVQPRLRAQLRAHTQKLRTWCLGSACWRATKGVGEASEGGLGSNEEEGEEEDVVALVDAVLAKEQLPRKQLVTHGDSPGQLQGLSDDRVVVDLGTPLGPSGPSHAGMLQAMDTPTGAAGCPTLLWRNLGFEAQTAHGRTSLVAGTWGQVEAGQLMAVLGPSGSGKSTLIEMLAFRRPAVSTRGPFTSSSLGVPAISDGTCATSGSAGPFPGVSNVMDSPCGSTAAVMGSGPSARSSVISTSRSTKMAATAHDSGRLEDRIPAPGDVQELSPAGAADEVGPALQLLSQVQALQPELLLDGVPATADAMRRACAYVAQDDVLLPQLTVGETLTLAAAFGADAGGGAFHSSCAVRVRVTSVMAALGLAKHEDTLVGGPLPGGITLRGLSGGERKRLGIGTALVHTPRLLLADEPTSGLDAFAALSVMAHLAAMARGMGEGAQPCAVLVTIHQPRAAIWDMLDKVLVLAAGRMIYEGDPGGLVPWLSQHLPCSLQPTNGQFAHGHEQLMYDAESHGTPADWVVDVAAAATAAAVPATASHKGCQCGCACGAVCVGDSSSRSSSQQASEGDDRVSCCGWAAHVADVFLLQLARKQPKRLVGETSRLPVSQQAPGDMGADAAPGATAAADAARIKSQLRSGVGSSRAAATDTPARGSEQSDGSVIKGARVWWRTYRALVWRERLAVTRNPADVAGRMLTFLWVSLVGNFLLYGGGHDPDGAGSIRIRLGWQFAALFFYLVCPFLFMSVFTADKRVFLADIVAGRYSTSAYLAAKLTATLPLNITIAIAFAWSGYGMFGFRHSAAAVAMNTVLGVLFSLVALQWMFFCAAFAPNQDIAFGMAVCFAILNLLVNSFFMGPMDPPGAPWVRRLRYISAQDYAWQGFATAEFKDRVFACGGGGEGAGLGLDALGIYPRFIPAAPRLVPFRSGLQAAAQDPACYVSGNAVLRYYRVHPHVGVHIGALVAYLFVLHALTALALVRAARRVRAGRSGGATVVG